MARIEGLEPALVEEFLRALEFGDEPRHQDLEERIVAAPDDPDGYEVYADWLEAHGDEQAALIRSTSSVRTADYAAGFGIRRSLEWRHGFVRKAAWFRDEDDSDWRQFLRHRAFALIEELRICDSEHLGLGNFDFGPVGPEAWATFARLPLLHTLALDFMVLRKVPLDLELPGLLHLNLHWCVIEDTRVLPRLPSLRSLSLTNDEFYLPGDLTGLALLPALETVAIDTMSSPRSDLPEALARCENLRTLCMLDRVSDLRAFIPIPQLRRLVVPEEALDRVREVLRSVRPDLEVAAITQAPRSWWIWPHGTTLDDFPDHFLD